MLKLPFSLPDVVKYPLHAVVYLLLTYFVYKEFTKKDECADLRKQIATMTKQYDSVVKRLEKVEGDKDQLTYSIAVKSGIIERLKLQKDTVKINSHENSN